MSELTKMMLEHQGDTAQLRPLLVEFRASKQQQLQSIETAALLATVAALSGFALLGLNIPCSWPCPTLWCSSLFLSLFAMNTTWQLKLLEPLPRTSEEANRLDNDTVRRLLLTVAAKEDRRCSSGKSNSAKDEMRPEEGGDPSMALRRDLVKSWVWQSPKILAWLSWVPFLLGFIYDALVLFNPEGLENKNTHQVVIIQIPIVIAYLALFNFFVCGITTNSALLRLKTKQGANDDVSSSGDEG